MPRFKKQEQDLITHFDKWMYVLKNLPRLQERPKKLQEKVFEKLFAEAELAKLTPEDMRTYEESLKVYRDNYSVLETMRKEGKEEGRKEGLEEAMLLVARGMKQEGDSIEKISRVTGLSKEQVEGL